MIPISKFWLIVSSLGDENALRSKVSEALTVYDEYMKNKGEPDDATKQGAKVDDEADKAE